ncbi:MAG: RDD family protein [Candidatus Nanohaloarchaea archaeon]
MEQRELEDWIEARLDEDYTEDEIRTVLQEKDVSPRKVRRAFRRLEGGSRRRPSPSPRKGQDSGDRTPGKEEKDDGTGKAGSGDLQELQGDQPPQQDTPEGEEGSEEVPGSMESGRDWDDIDDIDDVTPRDSPHDQSGSSGPDEQLSGQEMPEEPDSGEVDMTGNEAVAQQESSGAGDQAGLMKRAGALLVDSLAIAAVWTALFAVAFFTGLTQTSDAVFTVFQLLLFLLMIGYFVVLEARDGQTLGKRLMSIKVVGDDGSEIGYRESAIRNLLRVVDGFPIVVPYAPAIGLIYTREDGKRLGDIAADTTVVRE